MGLTLAKPENFALETKNNYLAEDQQLRVMAQNAFSADTAITIFSTVFSIAGCDPKTDPDCRSQVVKPGPGSGGTASPDCNCNTVSDWCGWVNDCTGNCIIDTQERGCGTFWTKPCQGSCQ